MTRLRRYLPHLLFTVALMAAPAAGLAQEEGPQTKTLLDVIMHGGPLIMTVWITILGTSITMVTLIVQNIMTLKAAKLAPPPLVQSLRQTIAAGNYQEAWEICAQNKNYLANVLKAALTRIGRGKEAVEDAVAEVGLREATLLGTVIGMMGAFAVLGSSGISNPQALSASIGEVLAATAAGLFIAIPAFVAYYIFRNVSQKVLVVADDIVNSLLLDIPYEELSGVQIGENFSAGAALPGGGARKVSMSLTTNCPVCSGAVSAGVNPCPHCGATLDWAA
jgi:biopolymer transport protein ExbB